MFHFNLGNLYVTGVDIYITEKYLNGTYNSCSQVSNFMFYSTFYTIYFSIIQFCYHFKCCKPKEKKKMCHK